jgi:putative thiamine transport system ATP-binding protein
MTGLALSDIRIAIGDRVLIDRLGLAVAPGETATIMGPSGSGKSSLLAYVGGWIDPVFAASGELQLDGQPLAGVPPERRRIGVLFQDALLFPHLSVGENLAFALPPAIRGAQRRQKVEAALDAAELAGFAERDPATLSGGQKARIALFRTLLSEPRALLLDEPFGALDAELKDRVREFVFRHVRESRLPTLLVTHDSEDARAAGGPIVSL